MNRSILALAVVALSTGCGFGLTPGAVHCGTHQPSGMDVWVDGVGTNATAGGSATNILADGGTVTTYEGMPYMTCDQAMKTIDQALAIGDTQGFWEKKDETYGFLGGIRVEFVGASNLAAIGQNGSDGYTQVYLGVRESAIAYGKDWNFGADYKGADYNSNPAASFDPSKTWPSAVILVHEMTHMLDNSGFMNLGGMKGETSSGGHCNWARDYAPRYSKLGEAQFASNFGDTCQNKQCSGSACHESLPDVTLTASTLTLPHGGGSVTLKWSASGSRFDSLSIFSSDPAIVTPTTTATSGSVTVTVTGTTEFVVKIRNGTTDYITSAFAQVTVAD